MTRWLVVPALLVAAGNAHAQVIQCAGAGDTDTNLAYDFIADNAGEIAKVWTNHLARITRPLPRISGRRQARFSREFAEIWRNRRFQVLCKDDSTECRNHGNQDGWAPGREDAASTNKPQIMLCYRNHVDRKATRCDLVDTIVHETAHQIDVPAAPGHNSPAVQRNRDLVYRFGWAARDVCRDHSRAGRFPDGTLGRPGSPSG